MNILWAKNQTDMYMFLSSKKIKWIIFSFWSNKISEGVVNAYNCISFHAGDLPNDRGGSPIQNQIIAGKTHTKLSAFKTSVDMDAGPIYLKEPLSLDGDLIDIHIRISHLVVSMAIKIITKGIGPKPQQGKPTFFKRRTPEQSEIKPDKMTAEEIYNLIRCLNMAPYPHAFIRGKDGKRVFVLKAVLE